MPKPSDQPGDRVGTHAENAASPGEKRSSGRAAPKLGELPVVVEAAQLPGRTMPGGDEAGGFRNVHIAIYTKSKERPALAIQNNPWLAADPVPGDARSARWRITVTVRRDADGFDFTGPYVRGARGDRHIGLAWGDVRDDGTLRLIRGSKLKLADVGSFLIEQAMSPGHQLTVRLRLTGTENERIPKWSEGPAD